MTTRKYFAFLAAAAAFTVACGGGDDGEPASCASTLRLDESGVHASDGCGAELSLMPRVRVDGSWQAASACAAAGDGFDCSVGTAGSVHLSATGPRLSLRFDAAEAGSLEAIVLDGHARIAGARGWLSNGFHSWSQSGVVALSPPPSQAELDAALALKGDGEVAHEGSELSNGYTFVGGGKAGLVIGTLSEQRFKSWMQVHREPARDDLTVRAGMGGGGEAVSVAAGDAVEGEPLYFEIGQLHAALEHYAAELPTRRKTAPRSAQVGWNSWYELWDTVDDPAVRANAALAKDMLGSYAAGLKLRVVVDDGWQQAWGDWQPNAKFPTGLSGLAQDLHAQGFDMGVWLAPLLVAENSAVAQAHPDWLVGGATYKHPKHGTMHILDVTRPEAAAHLAQVISTIVGWGYDLLKIDFLFAGTFEGTRAEPVTGMEAYARALDIIRKAAGEDTVLVAVGAPGVASLPFVDGWRLGGDIALENTGVRWAYLPSQARSLAARWPLCRATLCDADPVVLRELEHEEVDTGANIVAFAGGALFLSDDLRVLPAERKSWGIDAARAGWALSGAPAEPEDLVPEKPPELLANVFVDLVKQSTTHVVPERWRTPDGRRFVINWSEEPKNIAGRDVAPHATVELAP